MLVEARNLQPRQRSHWRFPGGEFTGLLWGYGKDNDRRPLWEVRPGERHEGSYLLHVNSPT